MPDFTGKAVLVMGYGLNMGGSGPQAAKYLAERGAQLTITDLRSAEVLAPTMQLLKGYDVRWVLEHHDQADFDQADIVIKNPGVHKNSPFLVHVKQIETDLSLFLYERQPKIIAVTGSKGKSSVSSLIFHVLQQAQLPSHLGGNITVSPLTYLDAVRNEDFVVLELSSWQSGDLSGRGLLKPVVSVITNIFPDHQNYYQNNMQDYVQDKAGVLLDQNAQGWAVLNLDDEWTPFFTQHTRGNIAYFSTQPLPVEYSTGAYLRDGQIIIRKDQQEITINIAATHVLLQNLMIAALSLYLCGLEISVLESELQTFQGLKHRLELVAEKNAVAYYNDSAATIPLATVSSIQHLTKTGKNLHVIFGGADKELDFSPLVQVFPLVSSWHIFSGSAFEKIDQIFMQNHISYSGPFDNMTAVLDSACAHAKSEGIILMSPGCASFGLFLNEFDRGIQFCQAVEKID